MLLFTNRTEAGKQLAQELKHYRGKPGVIFPLPRGGVTLGVELARMLEMPIDLVIPRKVGYPIFSKRPFCLCCIKWAQRSWLHLIARASTQPVEVKFKL
jgi:predicted phosphoribosyltransferase